MNLKNRLSTLLQRLSHRMLIGLVSVILALIVCRLMLPSVLLWYVNRTLDQIPSYSAQAEAVDVALWRGAYTIKGLHLFKKGKDHAPFLDIQAAIFSVQWKALLEAKVVAEVELKSPQMNIERKGSDYNTPESGEGWEVQAQKLFPFEINRLSVEEGTVVYLEPDAHPPIDLRFTGVQAEIKGLTSRPKLNNPLPTNFKIQAHVFKKGKLNFEGSVSIFTNQPKDRFATVIPISGTIESPDSAYFVALTNILKNAFFKAFEPGFEKREK